jgi:hypothetical protein
MISDALSSFPFSRRSSTDSKPNFNGSILVLHTRWLDAVLLFCYSAILLFWLCCMYVQHHAHKGMTREEARSVGSMSLVHLL